MKPIKFVDKIEIWEIRRLIPYAKNPVIHSKTQVAQIKASLERFGMINPVLVDSQGNVIAGHGVILAAKSMGLTHLPVIVLDHLTDAEVRALRIAHNRIAENREWDNALLSEELAELLELKIDLKLLGYNDLELKRLVAEYEARFGQCDEDDIPALCDRPVTILGEQWILGENQFLCGDSTDLPTVQNFMEGAKAHLIFTDLPYNVGYKSSSRAAPSRPILNDDLGKDFGQFLYQACVVMLDVSGGAIYIFMSSSELHTLLKAFTDAGGHWSTFVIWAKNTFTLGRADFQKQWEPMLYGWKKGGPHYWCGARNTGDVWFVDKPYKNDLHPTMKPVQLAEKAILLSSQEGDLVLDPYAGAGSTLIACHKNGRRGRLIELDPLYVDVAVARWQDFSGDKARLSSTRQTFDELREERLG
jgi:DNA modification methylase